MEIITGKVKLKLSPEEALQLIKDETFETLICIIFTLETSLKLVNNEFEEVKEELINKVSEKAKKENKKDADNLIEKLYNNLVKNTDSEIT